MKKHQVWGFNYIEKNGINLITGTKEESEEEFNVTCFDGIAIFEARGKCYVAKYPRIRILNNYYKDKIKNYCGYYPSAGEYGVIMGALGLVIECDKNTYDHFRKLLYK